MDSVELARQVAAELHARLVASGADPWSPYDFAVAEAKRRGIDVEPTAVGAAVLNGGRATFVAADDLILHENIGSRFEQAFLVAHEIGHVELGDDPEGEPAPAIDPARAAEPSPVGIDRVPVSMPPMNSSSATRTALTSAILSLCQCNCSKRTRPSVRRCRRDMIMSWSMSIRT